MTLANNRQTASAPGLIPADPIGNRTPDRRGSRPALIPSSAARNRWPIAVWVPQKAIIGSGFPTPSIRQWQSSQLLQGLT